MISDILQYAFLISFLIFLEGILSIDNAVVMAIMVKHLPKDQQRKALTYGLVGALVFRFIALATAAFLIKWRWLKFIGGGYLILIALKHLLGNKDSSHEETATVKKASFWKTVVMIELMDIVFAIDSILAAVALSPNFWIVFTGGMIGVICIRFAASYFVKLLSVFPAFEKTAYILVLIIGVKLGIEGFHIPGIDFSSASSPAFWIFWISMALSVLYGIRRR
ncbi:MAG: hypothetical protein AAB116_01760 [Candidatus Poribacteria bacterium]